MKQWWKVTFTEKGAVDTVQLVGSTEIQDGLTQFVYEETYEKAKRAAYNLYCNRKKKEAKTRKHDAGQCVCGRKQDRKHPSGSWMLTCSTCAERQKGWNADMKVRQEKGITNHKRDEGARAAACSERIRDRKAEMRFEVLTEVKNQWENARTSGLFTHWLREELEKCRHASTMT